MPLTRLEHDLVLSDDIHKTRDFYCDALGMTEGFQPQLEPVDHTVFKFLARSERRTDREQL